MNTIAGMEEPCRENRYRLVPSGKSQDITSIAARNTDIRCDMRGRAWIQLLNTSYPRFQWSNDQGYVTEQQNRCPRPVRMRSLTFLREKHDGEVATPSPQYHRSCASTSMQPDKRAGCSEIRATNISTHRPIQRDTTVKMSTLLLTCWKQLHCTMRTFSKVNGAGILRPGAPMGVGRDNSTSLERCQ
ncbi:hypothetical protein BKA93DRAFT_553272 [Sparassis latifolia]